MRKPILTKAILFETIARVDGKPRAMIDALKAGGFALKDINHVVQACIERGEIALGYGMEFVVRDRN